MVIVSKDGIDGGGNVYAPGSLRIRTCVFETRIFFRGPIRVVFGRSGLRESLANNLGRLLAQEHGCRGRYRGAGAGFRGRGGIGLFVRVGAIPFSRQGAGIDKRNHYVGRTFIEPSAGHPRLRE